VALAVLNDGAMRYTIPLESMIDALRTSLGEAEMVGEELETARYHERDGQWAIFGQVLPEGGSMRITNLTMEERVHAIFGAGDSAAEDLDLFVRLNARLLGSDTAPDAVPVVVIPASAGGGYEIEIRNVRSNGPSLVVASIVE
jgi:hypothetical protein